jgi:hypothetical protein
MSTIVSNPYSHINAVSQNHRNACWAACLEFWAKAVNNNNSITQHTLRNEAGIKACYEHDSETNTNLNDSTDDGYGKMEAWELLWLMRQPRWGMQVAQFTRMSSKKLKKKLQNGPVFIGFYDLSGNTWHVNVICGYDSTLKMVSVMEPRSGQFEDKSYSEFIDYSAFNIVGWK